MKTNAQVAAAFIRREHAQSGSMTSDGTVLWSYATPIARHDDAGRIIVSSQHHSPTTTRHHSELWSAAYAAGYEGSPNWHGNDEANRRTKRVGCDTVPFHDEQFPATRYGRNSGTGISAYSAASYGYDSPGNSSDHDARAVVWEWSPSAYDDRAENREWYERRNHTTVTRKGDISQRLANEVARRIGSAQDVINQASPRELREAVREIQRARREETATS